MSEPIQNEEKRMIYFLHNDSVYVGEIENRDKFPDHGRGWVEQRRTPILLVMEMNIKRTQTIATVSHI